MDSLHCKQHHKIYKVFNAHRHWTRLDVRRYMGLFNRPPDNPSPLCIQSYIPSISNPRNGGVCQRTTYEHSVPTYSVPVDPHTRAPYGHDSRTSPCFGNDVAPRTLSHTSQGCGTLQSNESRSWYSTVKLVKVVGLYSQTSQGRGIDVTTSPDFTAPQNDPQAEQKWHAS